MQVLGGYGYCTEYRVEQFWQLVTVLNLSLPPPKRDEGAHSDSAIREQIVAIIAPHAGELRCDATYAMRLLRSLAFAGTHPRITDGQPFTAAEIVAILLDGIRRREDPELS